MSLVVSLPSVLYAAAPFYRSAVTALRRGCLAHGPSDLAGITRRLRRRAREHSARRGEIYFDSVTALVFLLLVGRLLQLRQQRRATESSELLYALTPSSARRLDADGTAHRVPLEALRIGDRIEVRVGERVPTDGVVDVGSSAVDMSLLSGESMPDRRQTRRRGLGRNDEPPG
jgi:Cu2+-exporting ATPase